MSIQHVAAVLYHMPELRELSSAAALIAIADSADRGSGWSFHITVGAIAKAARLKERATQYALRELERRGYIRTEAGGAGRTPRYRLLFDMNGKRKTEKDLYDGGAPRAPGRGAPRAPGGASRAPGGAPRAPGGAPNDAPPNNPPIGVPVLSPSFNQRAFEKTPVKKIRRARTEAPTVDVNAEKQRQRAAIEAKLKEHT